uniref:Uncharacterized protein n=1 Tax=Trypanosoma vivax (strain Y486) TaxID=1055687 RepID=G0TY40_TRYVY|nr:hypothetical protein, unlikely [Trypanosoma vivax Y486]
MVISRNGATGTRTKRRTGKYKKKKMSHRVVFKKETKYKQRKEMCQGRRWKVARHCIPVQTYVFFFFFSFFFALQQCHFVQQKKSKGGNGSLKAPHTPLNLLPLLLLVSIQFAKQKLQH